MLGCAEAMEEVKARPVGFHENIQEWPRSMFPAVRKKPVEKSQLRKPIKEPGLGAGGMVRLRHPVHSYLRIFTSTAVAYQGQL